MSSGMLCCLGLLDQTKNALQSFKMLEPTHPKAQCYIPEALNHQ